MKKVKSIETLQAASATVLLLAAMLFVLTGWLVFGHPNSSDGTRLLHRGGLASWVLPVLLGGITSVIWFLFRRIRGFNHQRQDLAKLSLVASKTDNAVILLNKEGRIDWVNDGFRRITGYSLQDTQGKALGPLLLGTCQNEQTIQTIQDALSQKKGVTLEMFCTHKQGSHYWFSLHLTPVFNEHECPAHFVGVGSDVTPRKRVEEALVQVNRRNELLLNAMCEGICGIDLYGLISFVNPAATRMTGWKSEEIIGKPVSVLLYSLHLDAMPESGENHFIDVAFKDGSVVVGDSDMFRRRDNTRYPVEYTSTPIREEQRVVGSVLVFRDISERKQSEAIRARQARQFALRAEVGFALATGDTLRQFLQGCSQAMVKHLDAPLARIWTFKPADNMLELQASAGITTRLDEPDGLIPFGTTKVGMIAKSRSPERVNHLLSDPDEVNKAWLQKEKLSAMLGAPLVVDNKLVAVVVLYSSQPLPEDSLEALISVGDSIGQGIVRKRAERKVAEQAELLNKSKDAILVTDLSSHCEFWNKNAERLYGWPAEEICGQRIDQLFIPHPSEFDRIKREIMAKGEWQEECTHVTRNGHPIIVVSHWTLLRDDNGLPKSILIINEDVTEKKEMETKFLRAQRIESIGTLAGGIAHDLNNVLSPILMSVELLKEKFKDEQSQRILSLLETNAKRGADMVKQVLSFSRGVDGERVLIQTRHLIREVAKIVTETFPKSITLKTQISENLWTILGDATQLHQVLVNLTVNARDAMPQGGTLTITAENSVLDKSFNPGDGSLKPGFYVRIQVTDTGTGIPLQIQDKIFEPFFTTKAVGQGTGLGLSTVLGIVKGHGGVVHMRTEMHRGTTFSIHLPAFEAVQKQTGESNPLRFPTGKGETILAVDDEVSVLSMTKEMLEMYGYRVLTARDGTEAVAAFTEHRQEIKGVLTDMLMPYMDGPATIRTLKKIDPNVRIIAASGLMDSDKVRDATGLDNIAFLMKPYTADKLLNAIHKAIYSEQGDLAV
jgi:PAS domain S-box-containing protein